MRRYTVYLSGGRDQYFKTEAKNSFDARRQAAEYWDCDVTDVYAVPD